MSNTQFSPEERGQLLSAFTNALFPAEYRKISLLTLLNGVSELNASEYLGALGSVATIRAEEFFNSTQLKELVSFTVKTVSQVQDPALRRKVIVGLREYLAGKQEREFIQAALSDVPVEENPVARRINDLIANPSAIYAEIRRESLVRSRRDQINNLLRSTPLLREVIATAASDRELGTVMREVLGRRSEFYLTKFGEFQNPELGYEAVRWCVPVFSALAATRRGRDLLHACMSASNQDFSARTWAELKSTPCPYIPEIVIGSGPSSANYVSTLTTLAPSHRKIVIESLPFAGGQFAAIVDPALYLNSRARPFGQLKRENLPGTESPLNTLGPYAPVQESDLTSQVYGDQTNIGLAIELDQFLAGGVLCSTRLTRWNFVDDGEKGRYLVELQNSLTGETVRVRTDKLVFARGLGSPRTAVDMNDPETAKIVREETEKASRGERSRYLKFPLFMYSLFSRKNSFPLRGIKTAAVIGDGDGGNVAVEALLGYGPIVGIGPQELDRVEMLYWYGQSIKTKEEFERCSRNRYVPIANDFPRESNPAADFRIQPNETRASRLRRSEGGRIILLDENRVSQVVDVVADCSGFDRPSAENLYDPLFLPKEIEEASVPIAIAPLSVSHEPDPLSDSEIEETPAVSKYELAPRRIEEIQLLSRDIEFKGLLEQVSQPVLVPIADLSKISGRISCIILPPKTDYPAFITTGLKALTLLRPDDSLEVRGTSSSELSLRGAIDQYMSIALTPRLLENDQVRVAALPSPEAKSAGLFSLATEKEAVRIKNQGPYTREFRNPSHSLLFIL